MILPVLNQGGLFLGAVAAGFVLAFFYDLFRVARRIVPHPPLIVHIEDFIYWVIVVAVMFYFLLVSNKGEVRLFSIAGSFIGMLVYFRLVSPIFLKFSIVIYEALKKIVLLLLSIIYAPIKAVIYILSFPAEFAFNRIKRAYDYERRLYGSVKIKSKHRAKKIKNNLRIILKKI